MPTDSAVIDGMVEGFDDWRGRAYQHLREIVRRTDPEIVEELKWKRPANPIGSPVYSRNGIVCTGAILKNSVRLTFLKGAFLSDPMNLFNFHLDSRTRRAVDVREGEDVNDAALKAIVRAAVALNLKSKQRGAPTGIRRKPLNRNWRH